MSEFDDFDGYIEEGDVSSASAKMITDAFSSEPAFKIGVVGVGQCGCGLAQAFYHTGYRRVLLVNTAEIDLNSIPEQIPKLAIDKQGAGKDPEVGKNRVDVKSSQIRNGMLREFGDEFDKIIVCMGLGGGTGSGGGPQVIQLAKDIIKDKGGNPAKDVIVFVTLPDPIVDGQRQCFNALKAYGEVVAHKVPLVIIDNSQVSKIIKSKLADGWTNVNKWIVGAFHRFNASANRPSNHGAFDGNDFNDILSRGRLLFSKFTVSKLGEDKHKAAEIMVEHLERSLFAKCDIKTAAAAGFLVVINPRISSTLSMDDIAPAFEELNKIMRPNSTLHRGIYIPNDWAEQDQKKNPDMLCFVMLAGMDHPKAALEILLEKAKSHNQTYGSLSAYGID